MMPDYANMKKILILTLLLFITSISAFSNIHCDSLKTNTDELYIFRLKTGDELTGTVKVNSQDAKGRKFLEIESSIGTSMIYHDEIAAVRLYEEIYKHAHRIFLMPTAEPIGSDVFIGNLEALFLYGGIGITKYFSATFARSMVPFLYDGQQITELNVKSTFYQRPLTVNGGGHLSVAAGANVCWINRTNSFKHYYGALTFRFKKSGFTANMFFKQGGQDAYEIRLQDNIYPVIYPSGTFGVGLGVDTKFSDRHNLFFIGEVWNKNIQNFYETFVTLGFRIGLDKCAVDWGLMFFTAPYVVPYFNFVWTPF